MNARSQGALRAAAWLVGLLRPFAGWVALAVGLGAATTAAGVGLLGASAYLIATAALHPSVAALQVAIVGVRFFGIARAGLRYLERLASHWVNFTLLARLRVWFYQALEPLVPARLVDYRSGDLLARMAADIEALENFYVRAAAPPLAALVVVCGVSLWVGRYDPRLGALLAAALALGGAGLPLSAHALGRGPGAEVTERRAELHNAVVDVAQGMGDLLACNQEQAFVERAVRAGQALSAAQLRLGRAGALVNALGLFLSGLALVGVLVVGIPLVGSRMDGVALAVLALVTLASFEATAPLSPAGQYWQSSLTAAGRLLEVVEEENPPRTAFAVPSRAGRGEEDENTPAAGVEVIWRGVRLAYGPGLPPALDGVSLDVPPGTHAAIVGPSGAGKSTLFAALLRLWDYQEGEIWLDGRDLRSYEPETLRRSLAYAPQSAYLFAGTLRHNLLLCYPEAGAEAVEWALGRAGLAEWVARLPAGLETRVGERGLQVSGGERQRVALARALLAAEGRARLLLLDEPTAHLDAITERRFLRDLRQTMQGRTLLLVTHRLVGLEAMDQVIVMQEGRVTERGPHAELARAGGWYARMWKIQNEMI